VDTHVDYEDETGEKFQEYFFANCKDEKIAECVKALLA